MLFDWLSSHLGPDVLRAGSGVLDIAGGKGDVALALAAAGVPCTVVDPRPCLKRDGSPTLPEGTPGVSQILSPFDHEGFVAAGAPHEGLMASASLLLGMHPDEATEAIVDAALLLRKPFAIVPCCVFLRALGGHRTLLNTVAGTAVASAGAVVATYEDYLDFLQAKDPRIKRTFLNFRGRNVVLSLLDYSSQDRPLLN